MQVEEFIFIRISLKKQKKEKAERILQAEKKMIQSETLDINGKHLD